jgi:hypothetical protein
VSGCLPVLTGRILLTTALVAGCTRFDSSGLDTDTPLTDAAPVDSIARFDAAPDTVQLADSGSVEDTRPDDDADADSPDVAPLPFCDSSDATLIACYRFEQAEHAMQPWDESKYGHHGTATKVAYAAGPPGAGKAIVVDNMSLVRVPYFATLGVTSQLTIEAWIKVRTLPATGRAGIVDDNGRYGLFIHPMGILQATAPTALYSAPIITTGVWLHVAYTYDGAKQVLYVSGLQITSQALAGGTYGMSDGSGLAIGSNSPSGDPLDGSIDSVRIFKVARTPAQICEAAGKSPC